MMGSVTLLDEELVPMINVREVSEWQRNLITYGPWDAKLVLVHELVMGLK